MKEPPLPLEEAQARLLALVETTSLERVDIDGALGRYLANALDARRTQPACDLSAMDGYAVRADGTSGPWRIIGESAAGHPCPGEVGRGEAVRISTGAVMPKGAGSVILQEDVAVQEREVRLTGDAPCPPGKHIRRRGMDFAEGSAILKAGERIGPAQIALAIASGHKHLPVRRKPSVMVIDSGDELTADCDECEPHQVPASNGAMIAALAHALPCDTQHLGPVRDDVGALIEAFDAAQDADVIVTTGGASVGHHDLVRPAMEQWGAEIDFWRIAIKPGKPLLIATRRHGFGQRRQLILGLPGNPVSSHVTAFLFLLPALRAMLGAAEPLPRRFHSRLSTPLRAGGSRREFLRAFWDGATITPQANQDSGALFALSQSNVLIDRPAGAPELGPGEDVEAFLLGNGGIA